MKTATCLAIAIAGSAHADVDTVFTVEFDVTTSTGEIRAEYFGDLPGATTRIGCVWSDAWFRMTGNGPIDILAFNPGYSSQLFGDPDIDGRGTDVLEFVGVQPTPQLGSPDGSNPLWVADFSYGGLPGELGLELLGQNSALFLGDPSEPLGTFRLYNDVNPDPRFLLTWRVDVVIIPTPATLAVAPLILVAAHRRRK